MAPITAQTKRRGRDRIVRFGEHTDNDSVHRRQEPQRAGSAARAGGREGHITDLEDIALEVEVERIVPHREARALLHAGYDEADDAATAMNLTKKELAPA